MVYIIIVCKYYKQKSKLGKSSFWSGRTISSFPTWEITKVSAPLVYGLGRDNNIGYSSNSPHTEHLLPTLGFIYLFISIQKLLRKPFIVLV